MTASGQAATKQAGDSIDRRTANKKDDAEAEKETTTNATDSSFVDKLAAAIERTHITDEQVENEVQKKNKNDKEEDEELLAADAPPELIKVASWIQQGACSKILVVSGAGVSVSAGIPDFRTPGTGLYDNLQTYNLPYPEAVFDLDYYRRKPGPFVSLAKEIWPGLRHTPTLTHSFVALLAAKDLLLRNYSQNIDGLEYLANIPDDLLVECHGHFRTASCIQCHRPAESQYVKKTIVEHGQVPVCQHKRCHGLVKPDIVFFGEGLPDRFHKLLRQDLRQADLCLILGTSLQVAPVSCIPDMVSGHCKRVLLNRELVGNLDLRDGNSSDRDLFHAGDCDDSIRWLARLLGWEEELSEKHEEAKASIGTVGLPESKSEDKP